MKRLRIDIQEDLDDALAAEAELIARYAPELVHRDNLAALSGRIDGRADDSASIDEVVYDDP